MNLLRKLLGRDPPSNVPVPPADTPATARGWLAAAAARDGCVWRDLGALALPSRRLFIGDPTWGDDYHLRQTASVEMDALRVWVLDSGPNPSTYEAHANTLVWLEALGTPPATRGAALDFGVDAACFALGDVEAGHAFTRLTDHEAAAGRGDSFEWIQPYIQERPHVARWLEIPPDGKRMFVASTGRDGGFAATWLHDRDGALSGILIDILGRAGDGRFLDTLLPEHPAPPARG